MNAMNLVAYDTVKQPAPKRAYSLSLALQADTATDLAMALRGLADRIERGEVTNGVWGSPSDGAIYELLTAPDVTHDSYHAALRDYLNKRNEVWSESGKLRPIPTETAA